MLEGYKAIDQLLLENGADVSILGRFFGNSQEIMPMSGCEVIGRCLLKSGAVMKALGRFNNSAIVLVALLSGHEAFFGYY